MKRPSGNLAAVAIGLGAGLALAEIGARALYPEREDGFRRKEIVRVGIPPDYIQHVDRMPWAHSVTRFVVEGEYDRTLRINAKGLRGPEVPYEKPPSEFRLLYVGDSAVKALQVPFEQTAHQRAQALLRAAGAPVTVIGAGEAGWGTDQEYRYYRHEGRRYGPDLVICQLVMNDVANNARGSFRGMNGFRQMFSLRDGELVEKPLDPWPSPWFEYAAAVHRHLLLRSRLYKLLRDVWHGEGPAAVAQLVQDQLYDPDARTAPGREPHPQLYIYRDPYTQRYESAWRLTEALLVEWRDAVERDGARFALVSLPAVWAVEDAEWQRIPRDFPQLASEFARWDRDKPDARLQRIAERNAIPYLSLTDAFRAHAATGGAPLYGHKDPHPTAAGHALAARVLVPWLREQGLAP